jgi:hypothetical protein
MSKPIFITLDKKRELRFDFNALCLAETLGIDITDMQSGKHPLNSIRTLLYVGLTHEDSELTIEFVGTLIKPKDMQSISEKLGEALTEGFGEAPKNVVNPSKK